MYIHVLYTYIRTWVSWVKLIWVKSSRVTKRGKTKKGRSYIINVLQTTYTRPFYLKKKCLFSGNLITQKGLVGSFIPTFSFIIKCHSTDLFFTQVINILLFFSHPSHDYSTSFFCSCSPFSLFLSYLHIPLFQYVFCPCDIENFRNRLDGCVAV